MRINLLQVPLHLLSAVTMAALVLHWKAVPGGESETPAQQMTPRLKKLLKNFTFKFNFSSWRRGKPSVLVGIKNTNNPWIKRLRGGRNSFESDLLKVNQSKWIILQPCLRQVLSTSLCIILLNNFILITLLWILASFPTPNRSNSPDYFF